MLTRPQFAKSIRPIFIVGAPRSGTSITTWALGQHPNIQPMPETGWIATMAVGGFQSYGYGACRGRYSHLSNVGYELSAFMRRLGETVDRIVNDCFHERCERLQGNPQPGDAAEFLIRRHADDPKQRWVDGTPFNTFFAWALSIMFPEAVFIHNLRRPHEVVSSLEAFDKIGAISQAFDEGLRTWTTHTESAWLLERWLGDGRAFRLDFERISGDPEPLMRDLCRFLGEEYSPDCLLPFARRINSSDVDDRHAGNLERLRQLVDFRTAEALYLDAVSRPPSQHSDDAAGQALQERFIQYSRTHPLI